MNEFLQRLKQRKIVQWSLAYVAAAFGLMQGIDIVAQRFGWPEQTMRVVIIALSVGFFVTLVLAWYHGERGAQRISGTELVILALLLSLGGGFLWKFAGASHAPVVASAPAARAAISEKSIAVLPFDNLSDEKGNAYFAEGVQDEILTRLAKVADLKVISRTSTQRFKSAPENLPEIARQLGVAHILEGSVQKSGEQVRVNVQLIHAASDAHLWADTFDRKLTDIFAVESEIAKTIAGTLQAKLTGSEKILLAKKPTANPEAYELYLKGRFFWNKRTAADLRKSIDYFNAAIAKDPEYALAYAALAQAWVLLPAHNGAAPEECAAPAEAAISKALALDETSSDAHAALGELRCNFQFDFPGAAAEFDRALQLNPNDATARHGSGMNMGALGNVTGEVAELRRAAALDPLSLIIHTNLGRALIHARRFDEAIAHMHRTIEMDASFSYAHRTLGLALELQGKPRTPSPSMRRPFRWEERWPRAPCWGISTEPSAGRKKRPQFSSNSRPRARADISIRFGSRSFTWVWQTMSKHWPSWSEAMPSETAMSYVLSGLIPFWTRCGPIRVSRRWRRRLCPCANSPRLRPLQNEIVPCGIRCRRGRATVVPSPERAWARSRNRSRTRFG